MSTPYPPPGRRSRAYAETGGRVQAPDDPHLDVRLDTHVTAVRGDGGKPPTAHQARILDHCRNARAVAELSALLELPVGVTTVLVTELRTQGRVETRAPLDMTDDNVVSIDVLHRLKAGLHAL